jgi:ribosome maturation factor RimP
MSLIDENIKEIVTKVVERNRFLLIDLILRGTEHNRVIEVYIDGEKDVSADDCALVSREIDSYLKDLLAKHPDFRLDVSSPGIDRPLKFLKQYPKHVNRKFDISYRSGEEIKKLSGKLASVEGDYLTFISNNKEVIINFNNIVKANVMVSFS